MTLIPAARDHIPGRPAFSMHFRPRKCIKNAAPGPFCAENPCKAGSYVVYSGSSKK